jgi:hypothetical protein
VEGRERRLCQQGSQALIPHVPVFDPQRRATLPPSFHECHSVIMLGHGMHPGCAMSSKFAQACISLLPSATSHQLGGVTQARASVTLAALRNTRIVELMSNVLENLVAGEVMQASTARGWDPRHPPTRSA